MNMPGHEHHERIIWRLVQLAGGKVILSLGDQHIPEGWRLISYIDPATGLLHLRCAQIIETTTTVDAETYANNARAELGWPPLHEEAAS